MIATKWKDEIEVEGIKNAMKVSMPGYMGTVQFKKKAGNLLITEPAINPGNMPGQYAWVYKISDAF